MPRHTSVNREFHETRVDASLLGPVRRYCRLPDPVMSHEEATRLRHDDVATMSHSQALSELCTLQLWMPLQRWVDPWFKERVERLREALRHGR